MSKTYIKKEAAYEEAKSTASTFLIIGAVGIIALILVGFDIIPLSMETYTKVLMLVVMGALFAMFLIVGIVYQKRLASLKTEIHKEENLAVTISDWFFENFTAEGIDNQIEQLSEGEEALYFARCEVMAEALKNQFPDLNEGFADQLLEEFYGKLF